MIRPLIDAAGPWPEWPKDTVVILIRDWNGGVLVDLTVEELQTLQRMVRDEDQSKSKGTGGNP